MCGRVSEYVSKYNIFLYRVGTARGQPDLGPGQGRAGEGAQVSDVPLNDAPVSITSSSIGSGPDLLGRSPAVGDAAPDLVSK